MKKKIIKTYYDTLMADDEFRKRFEAEYQKIRLTNKKEKYCVPQNKLTDYRSYL